MVATKILFGVAVGLGLSACYVDEAEVMRPPPKPPAQTQPDANKSEPDGGPGEDASGDAAADEGGLGDAVSGDASDAGPGEAGSLDSDGGGPTLASCPRCTRLFDGSSLDAWVLEPADSWVIKGEVMANKDQDGQIYTKSDYGNVRVIFEVRRLSGNRRPAVVLFGARPAAGEPAPYALAGIQWEAPHGTAGDYRPGKSIAGDPYFTRPSPTNPDDTQWHRCEVLVEQTGQFRGACCPVPGTGGACPATEILRFSDPAAGRRAPFAIHVGARGSSYEYRNIWVESDPVDLDLVTTR